MYKKLIIAFLGLLFFSQEQQAMFRPSLIFLKNLKSSVTPFTKNFLKLANEIPFVENVQIISYLPIQKEVEEKIYQMQKNGTLIKLIVGSSVYKNQKNLVDKINERRSIIGLFQSVRLDWGMFAGFDEREIRYHHQLGCFPKIQTALFVEKSRKLSFISSRETVKKNPEQVEQCLLIIKNDPILKSLEKDFETMLQFYKNNFIN